MRISDWSTDVCSSDLLLGNNFLYRRPSFAGDQLHLSLRREFWIRHLDRQYASQALAHVVTGDIDFRALGVIVLLDELRSEEHTSELQSLMRISYAVFCLKKKPIVYVSRLNNHDSPKLLNIISNTEQ